MNEYEDQRSISLISLSSLSILPPSLSGQIFIKSNLTYCKKTLSQNCLHFLSISTKIIKAVQYIWCNCRRDSKINWSSQLKTNHSWK